MHLTGLVLDDTVWKSHWCWLSTQSSSWYATHPGKLGQRFNVVLSVEWRGVLDRKWNSEQLLIFAHFFLTNTLGTPKDREIWNKINHLLDLW